MKVMCIDNSVREGAAQGGLLTFGETYTVSDELICDHGLFKGQLAYKLHEIDCENRQFLASRFAPLSEIDERELAEQRLITA